MDNGTRSNKNINRIGAHKNSAPTPTRHYKVPCLTLTPLRSPRIGTTFGQGAKRDIGIFHQTTMTEYKRTHQVRIEHVAIVRFHGNQRIQCHWHVPQNLVQSELFPSRICRQDDRDREESALMNCRLAIASTTHDLST